MQSLMRVRAKNGMDKANWHDKSRFNTQKSKVKKNVKVINKVKQTTLDARLAEYLSG